MGTKRFDKIKIVVILGPTASGKSALAVKLAKKFNGEIISADSRQVYKGMDIGSGKITKKEMEGISHHLLNVASPKRRFSVGRYQKIAEKVIVDIVKKEKLPIICGGTAFYIRAITEGIELPKTKPNWRLRKELERKSVEELYEMLQSMDPRRADNIEKNNPRRLIRAIEIATQGPVPPLMEKPKFTSLKIGIKKENLDKAIGKRLLERIDAGIIRETKRLKRSGLSWKRLEGFGLEYRWAARYLQKKISYDEMIRALRADIIRFSKKQLSWFKKDEEIEWVKGYNEATSLVKDFLQKKERESSL